MTNIYQGEAKSLASQNDQECALLPKYGSYHKQRKGKKKKWTELLLALVTGFLKYKKKTKEERWEGRREELRKKGRKKKGRKGKERNGKERRKNRKREGTREGKKGKRK